MPSASASADTGLQQRRGCQENRWERIASTYSTVQGPRQDRVCFGLPVVRKGRLQNGAQQHKDPGALCPAISDTRVMKGGWRLLATSEATNTRPNRRQDSAHRGCHRATWWRSVPTALGPPVPAQTPMLITHSCTRLPQEHAAPGRKRRQGQEAEPHGGRLGRCSNLDIGPCRTSHDLPPDSDSEPQLTRLPEPPGKPNSRASNGAPGRPRRGIQVMCCGQGSNRQTGGCLGSGLAGAFVYNEPRLGAW